MGLNQGRSAAVAAAVGPPARRGRRTTRHPGKQGPQGVQETRASKAHKACRACRATLGRQARPATGTHVEFDVGRHRHRSKSLTVETGLAGRSAVIVAYDVDNTMTGEVASYDSGTGALVVTVTSVEGSGTYAAWTVNLSGAARCDGPQGPQEAQGAQGPQGDRVPRAFRACRTSGYPGIQGIRARPAPPTVTPAPPNGAWGDPGVGVADQGHRGAVPAQGRQDGLRHRLGRCVDHAHGPRAQDGGDKEHRHEHCHRDGESGHLLTWTRPTDRHLSRILASGPDGDADPPERAAGNVVQLDVWARFPAVDGRLLMNPWDRRRQCADVHVRWDVDGTGDRQLCAHHASARAVAGWRRLQHRHGLAGLWRRGRAEVGICRLVLPLSALGSTGRSRSGSADPAVRVGTAGNGNAGTAGEDTTFGAHVTAKGGAGGNGATGTNGTTNAASNVGGTSNSDHPGRRRGEHLAGSAGGGVVPAAAVAAAGAVLIRRGQVRSAAARRRWRHLLARRPARRADSRNHRLRRNGTTWRRGRHVERGVSSSAEAGGGGDPATTPTGPSSQAGQWRPLAAATAAAAARGATPVARAATVPTVSASSSSTDVAAPSPTRTSILAARRVRAVQSAGLPCTRPLKSGDGLVPATVDGRRASRTAPTSRRRRPARPRVARAHASTSARVGHAGQQRRRIRRVHAWAGPRGGRGSTSSRGRWMPPTTLRRSPP